MEFSRLTIIHTADWHIGVNIDRSHTKDRLQDSDHFLDQLTHILQQKQPDALLVCGDVFDSDSPGLEAQRLLMRHLLNIEQLCPDMYILIIAGNHDDGGRLALNDALWQQLSSDHIRLIGSIAYLPANPGQEQSRRPDLEAQIVRMTDADGHLKGLVGAVPYTYNANFPHTEGEEEDAMTAYFKALTTRMAQIDAQVPRLLMAHMALSYASPFEAVNGNKVIGGLETVDVNHLGAASAYNYLALGHIHKAQFWTPDSPANRPQDGHTFTGGVVKYGYAGSPMQLKFDEPEGNHLVWQVTFDAQQQAVATPISIVNPTPLHTLKATSFPAVLDLLQHYCPTQPVYLQLRVESAGKPPVTFEDEVSAVLKDLDNPNIRYIKTVFINPDAQLDFKGNGQLVLSADDLKAKDPLEVAQLFFDRYAPAADGKPFPWQDMLRQAMQAVDADNKAAVENESPKSF